MTLGFAIGDVGAWLFALWLCIDWFLNLDVLSEAHMKAMFKTGLDALAVLWGLGVSSYAINKMLGRAH